MGDPAAGHDGRAATSPVDARGVSRVVSSSASPSPGPANRQLIPHLLQLLPQFPPLRLV